MDQENFDYIHQFCSYQKQGFQLMILQECSLAHNSTPKNIWQKKGNNLYSPHQVIIKANSLIGCIGTNGFLNFQQLVGYVDSDKFISYFQILINKAESSYQTRKFRIILDNAPIHKSSKSLKNLEQQACLFLPPYFPQFNPIEQLWNQIKYYILNKNFYTGIASYQIFHQAFNNVQDQDIKIISFIPPLKFSTFQWINRWKMNEKINLKYNYRNKLLIYL